MEDFIEKSGPHTNDRYVLAYQKLTWEKTRENLRYPFPAKNSFIQVYKNELSYKRLRGRLVYSMQPIPYTL